MPCHTTATLAQTAKNQTLKMGMIEVQWIHCAWQLAGFMGCVARWTMRSRQAMFCWETAHVTLSCMTCLNIEATHLPHFSMATLFPDGSGLFQPVKAPCHTAKKKKKKCPGVVWTTWQWVQCADLAWSQHDRASLRLTWKTNLAHGSCTSQLTGLKQSASNAWLTDTTGTAPEVLWSPCLNVPQRCFGKHEERLHSFRLVALILWLIGARFSYGGSLCTRVCVYEECFRVVSVFTDLLI